MIARSIFGRSPIQIPDHLLKRPEPIATRTNHLLVENMLPKNNFSHALGSKNIFTNLEYPEGKFKKFHLK